MKLKIALIRHGEPNNTIGEIDHTGSSLSDNGKRVIHEKREAEAYPMLKHVYTCKLLCCRETANLIYQLPAVILNELGASDNEDSDGQALQELLKGRTSTKKGSQTQRAFLSIKAIYEANVKAGDMIRKVGSELERKGAEQCAIISNKMIILAVLRRYCMPRSNYEDWEFSFGGGYLIEYDTVEETANLLSKI